MPVAPDFLLKPQLDARPKALEAKPREDAPAARAKDSRFSDLYARERQSEPAARKAAAGSDAGRVDRPAAMEAKEAGDGAPRTDAGGKDLPPELAQGQADGDEEAVVLDPLLLLGMTGQLADGESASTAAPAVTPALLPEEAAAAATLAVSQALQGAQVTLSAESGGPEPALDADADAEAAASLPVGVSRTLNPGELAAQRNLSGQASGGGSASSGAVNIALNPEDAEPSALGKAVGQGLAELNAGQEQPREAGNEQFATRLQVAGQALGSAAPVAARLPVVPGPALPMSQPGISEAVVDRVMWLSSQNLKSAEIQLDPAELGRLEVRIELSKDQAAQVTFVSANASVRDQLEGQAHRLRELFAQQGMNQLDVNVSDQSLAREHARDQAGGQTRGAGGSAATEQGGGESLSGVSELRPAAGGAPVGLVDYYA